MKNIFLSIFILATYNLSAQLSTSLSEYRPKTIIQDENCRIQFYDSTGTQVHELLCGNLKYWYEKSYPYYGGKKIVIFDGFNKIYIENDGRLTSPTFSALDDSLDVWKQCNSFKTPLTVDVIGIDSVRVLDSVRVWVEQDNNVRIQNIDTTNRILAEGNRIDSIGFETVIEKVSDVESAIKSDCNGLNKKYYINGTNSVVINAGVACSYSLVVLSGNVTIVEGGITAPFPLSAGFSISQTNFGKILNNSIVVTGNSGGTTAIISTIE